MADPAPRKSPRAPRRKTGPATPAATPLRGRLPALAPALADALRAFHGRARQRKADGGTLQLHAGRAPAGDSAVIELDAEGSRVGLLLTAGTAAVAGDALHWQDYRGRARVLAWSLAHEATLVRLGEALGTALLPLVEADAAAGDDVVWLDFRLTADNGDDGELAGTLRLPSDWLARLQTRTDPPAPADPGRWRQLPAQVRIALTVPPLTVADLRSLRPGDVVVVGNARLPPLVAETAGLRWPVRSGPDGWRIDGPAAAAPRHAASPSSLETPPMTQQDTTSDAPVDDTAPAAPAEDPASKLPVQVEFDVGGVELPLGEIAGLQPGYVFALPTQLEGANVTIRTNGRVAGHGELVAVGDTLGVRLVSWS
ncbi:type III secretion system cytoplasmic ring protein SctQ [Luteimonas sp. BDR2-5]|uniref:type III secretion system cytoplasmic ring protein SctQ n=1 Tax=Proluteimonas luteida TaxID=2878685 RepID=UPI001E509306|nr:type III secretion system cytoplasmic ring protein SctQ [Luteimonas sp. BDR2-5]MCD9029451.1 type III secretion system cytoplasmic ring protein SctQ [Luteimonas sp. BDR2-5]